MSHRPPSAAPSQGLLILWPAVAGHVNPGQLVRAGCPGATNPLPVVGRDRGDAQLPCPHPTSPANSGCRTKPQQETAPGKAVPEGAFHPVMSPVAMATSEKAREARDLCGQGSLRVWFSCEQERNIYPPWDKMNIKKVFKYRP